MGSNNFPQYFSHSFELAARMLWLSVLLTLLLAVVSSVTAIPTIEAKGSKLFTSDGQQFFIKGMIHHVQSALRITRVPNRLGMRVLEITILPVYSVDSEPLEISKLILCVRLNNH